MYFTSDPVSKNTVTPEDRLKEDNILLQKSKSGEDAAISMSRNTMDNCKHPESMIEDNTGVCMGCGVYTGAYMCPLATAGNIPGVYHHTFSSAIVSSELRKKKNAESKPTCIDLTVQKWLTDLSNKDSIDSKYRETVTLPSSNKQFSFLNEDETETPKQNIDNDVSYMLPLSHPLYYGTYTNIKQATIFPPPIRSVVGNASTQSKRVAMYSVAFRSVSSDLIQGDIPTLNDKIVMPDGLFSTGSYKYSNTNPCLTFASDVSKDKQLMICKEITQDILNEIHNVFIENSSYLIKHRRRIHISLFVAIMIAHLRKIHGFVDGIKSKALTDNEDLCKTCNASECLNILQRTGMTETTILSNVKSAPRGRPKIGNSFKHSFIFALAARTGIPQNCMSRLQRIIFQICTHQSPTEKDEKDDDDKDDEKDL